MNPKIPMTMGLISTILAFICIFLPWMSSGNTYAPMWILSAIVLYTPEGFLLIATGALLILGMSLGLLGSITITKLRGRFSPLMLLVGAILSILSPPAWVITLIVSQYAKWLSLLSVGFWLELVAGILMLIASILGFVSLRKKPVETMIPPPPPMPPVQIS